MAISWPTFSVEEISEKVAMGPFGSSIKVETFKDAGVPVISGQHLHASRLQDGEYNFVSLGHAERLANANVQRGDVVLTHAGNIGQVAYIPENSRFDRYVISQRQFYIRPNKSKVIPEYLAYYFESPEGRHQLLANASSSGVPSIAQPVSYLRNVRIPVPPLAEQRRIARIIGTLDDKIDLNRRMSETLESIARALFKSWFVDFDPVRAKSEGRDPGLPPQLADLFPDSFEDSELGRIPNGWSLAPLGHLVEFAYGRALKAKDRRPGPIAVYGSNGQIGWHDEALVEGPGIVLGRKGNPGVVTWAPAAFYPIDTSFYIISKRNSLSLYFLFFALSGQDLASFAADSAIPGLNRSLVYRNPQLIPPDPILEVFDRLARSVADRAYLADRSGYYLAETRDLLLPKLLSGEFKTKNLQRIDGIR